MASPGSELGLALIGCGEVTRAKHLPALRRVPGVRVVAVADPLAAQRERVADAFRVPYRVAGVEAALALPGVDAVGVAVPPEQHAAVAIAALRAGKHVWIDKPLALTVADSLAIMRAAEETSAVAMIGFHMRYHRLVGELRSFVRSGHLGRIESIHSVWNSPRDGEGLPAWRWRREHGGGALIEIGVHHFDLWRFLLDTEVVEVFASSRDGERDDENAIVTATLENGVLATASLSERTSHQIEVEICGSAGRVRAGCLRFDGLEFVPRGDALGTLRSRQRRAGQLLASLPRGMVSMARGGEYRESYRSAWTQFVRMAQGARPPECLPVEGLRATEVALATVTARTRHAPVRVVRTAGPRAIETVAAGCSEESSPRRGTAAALEEPGNAGGLAFSVVVPTFRRSAALRELLAALAAQRLPHDRFEVVVVNDGGTDPLAGVIAPFREHLNIVLLEDGHRGCAGARQAGVAAARGRWLVFTDDDCRPTPEWLLRLEERCRQAPGCAIGGMVINGLPDNLYSEATQLTLSCLDERLNGGGACRFFPTCNLSFPGSSYAMVGGLDAHWPIAGGEDRDLCERWLRAGFRIVRADDCVVLHYHKLNLRSYWRQHFNYGQGAHLYRTRCASVVGSAPGLEALRFYMLLPASAFRRYRGLKAIRLSLLLALGQAANALGFAWQAFHIRREEARSGVPSRVAP
jgi:predicted dehydrogenase/glycosyltransferase involved in cell wall biosynthesis